MQKNISSKLELTIKDIGDLVIKSRTEYVNDILLPSGKTGISLFLYHCGKCLKNDKFLEHSYLYFEESFSALNQYEELIKGTTLHGGFTGVLWLYQYYINQKFLNFDNFSKETFSFFDEVVMKEIDNQKQSKNYDLLYGILGFGVYFLERNKFSLQEEKLNYIVDIIEDIAVEKEHGIVWEDVFYKEKDDDNELINLGFAHGLPSILVFLSYVYKNTGNKKSIILIEKIIKYLKFHELDSSKGSLFSHNILNDKPGVIPSRLAWCYGDLGIGYAILKAGILIANNGHIQYGSKILNSLTEKTIDDYTVGVKDAGFCHGASGVSHLFYKAFKYTKDINYFKSSEYWMSIALQMKNEKKGYSKYTFLENKNKWIYEPSNGLLEGSSGIGLCMVSHFEEIDPTWDLCFLL
ncbi:MAG: lanthionine synthetase C family protein [Vicingaceae bacterium]|nr:lanthionine synthetase C family protein [Vicingaceae bacterium]